MVRVEALRDTVVVKSPHGRGELLAELLGRLREQRGALGGDGAERTHLNEQQSFGGAVVSKLLEEAVLDRHRDRRRRGRRSVLRRLPDSVRVRAHAVKLLLRASLQLGRALALKGAARVISGGGEARGDGAFGGFAACATHCAQRQSSAGTAPKFAQAKCASASHSSHTSTSASASPSPSTVARSQ